MNQEITKQRTNKSDSRTTPDETAVSEKQLKQAGSVSKPSKAQRNKTAGSAPDDNQPNGHKSKPFQLKKRIPSHCFKYTKQ
ncbi:hypothetical protein ACFFIY_10385 [Bhargavaea ullalensis]|uniref:Uncharacterized protein n=1 Tax=Bhargavaea ullalensis TaxID=1265685 RepID=A0ABV2G9N3_9BACL